MSHPLRHTWPKIGMENHTHTPAVHGKLFHKGLLEGSDPGKTMNSRSVCMIFHHNLWPVCLSGWVRIVFKHLWLCHLCLKTNSNMSAEARVAKDSNGKSYTHSCCSCSFCHIQFCEKNWWIHVVSGSWGPNMHISVTLQCTILLGKNWSFQRNN